MVKISKVKLYILFKTFKTYDDVRKKTLCPNSNCFEKPEGSNLNNTY